MHILLSTLFITLLTTQCMAQNFSIAGRVTERETGQPLTAASVVCTHTTLGTSTNSNGEFTLILNNGGYDLAISFNGYETETMRISSNGEQTPLLVSLRKKQQNLEEVSVVVSNEVKDGLDKYGSFFRDQFLGMTDNSLSCHIENPETLRFFFNKKRNRLKVLASDEIQINNPALGYHIRYQLDSFTHEYSTGNTQYTGFPFFEEMTGTRDDSARWQQARLKAYFGSLLHFMRCYYDSTLGSSGYRVEWVDDNGKARVLKDPYDTAYCRSTDHRDIELDFPGKVRVVYLEEKPERAYLEFKKMSLNTTVQISILDFADTITIEENGYFFEQRNLLSLGYWGWEKLGDFLPYNYDPPIE